MTEKMKSRFFSGNASCRSLQFVLSSSLLFLHTNIKICGNIILPVVLYGFETWSLTLREKRRLRMFENWVLRKIFGLKRDEGAGEWRKLHKDELGNLYYPLNIIRLIKSIRTRWAGRVARMKDWRGAFRILAGGGPEGKGLLGRPNRECEDDNNKKCMFKKWVEALIGLIWLTIETGGGQL